MASSKVRTPGPCVDVLRGLRGCGGDTFASQSASFDHQAPDSVSELRANVELLQEIQQSSRPLTHRPSLSTSSSTSLPGRSTHARNNSHSHSLLTGALNANHRVTRRKSVTNVATNVAAIAAALREGEKSAALPIANTPRRNTSSKTAAARATIAASLPSPPASLPTKSGLTEAKGEHQESAIDDENDLSDEGQAKDDQARMRRASDGQPLSKDGKKSNRAELRCETCGKGYKHSSCLTKHLFVSFPTTLATSHSNARVGSDGEQVHSFANIGCRWEHTPEWSYTSKLLISKHQQVQLLEAASVLVTMNGTEASTTPPDSTKGFASDPESASPAASGYSDQAERQSSADTTPPPTSEGLLFGGSYRSKRHSSMGGLSRSYQSAPFSGSLAPSSVPYENGFGHSRQYSGEHRPSSSGINTTGEEDRDLAAAVELLSCSFGSNSGSRGTVTLPADAPPVPPVPAQYLDHATPLVSASFINSFPSRQPESFTRGVFGREGDVKMDEQMDSGMEDDDSDRHSRARSDEDDDGVFGRMEE